jgi:hypothetical protein
MKNTKLLPLILLTAALLVSGCATIWTGVVTLTEVRDSAMKELASLHVQGRLPAGADAQIAAADAKYRAAVSVAEQALVAYKNGGSEESYKNALLAVKAAITPLIDLVRTYSTAEKSAKLSTALAKANKL